MPEPDHPNPNGFPEWVPPLGQRIRHLEAARREGLRTAAFLHEEPGMTTFRYRGYNTCQYLEESSRWRGYYFFEPELPLLRERLGDVHTLVLIRYPWTPHLSRLLTGARSRGIPIIFDVDDLVFDPTRVESLANHVGSDLTLDHLRDYWFSQAARLWAVAAQADALVATTEALAEVLRQTFACPVHHLPNGLNREQIERSGRAAATRHPGGGLRAGYFSGTPTHRHDFQEAVPGITRWLTNYPDASLLIAGHLDLPADWRPWLRDGRIQTDPFTDYLSLQDSLSGVDLNLIPLRDNLFTRCKSELKFFEAALAGTPSIATANPLYQSLIEHGKNGFLCHNSLWYETLEEASITIQSLKEIGRSAQVRSLKFYAPRTLRPILERILDHPKASK